MMKSALICHHGDRLNEEGIARWMASFTDLRLIVSIEDPKDMFWKRLRAEKKRSGVLGLLDVLAFRVWFKFFGAADYSKWETAQLESLREKFPSIPPSCRFIATTSPNTDEVREALKEAAADFAIARCKRIFTEKIFSIPLHGIFVIHPGICPAYRNAHGCFWAIVNEDYENVGATLLQVNAGIDTGPILAFLRLEFDPLRESHLQIQDRAVFENLDTIENLIERFTNGELSVIDTTGSPSNVWGQPHLSTHLKWRGRYRSQTSS